METSIDSAGRSVTWDPSRGNYPLMPPLLGRDADPALLRETRWLRMKLCYMWCECLVFRVAQASYVRTQHTKVDCISRRGHFSNRTEGMVYIGWLRNGVCPRRFSSYAIQTCGALKNERRGVDTSAMATMVSYPANKSFSSTRLDQAPFTPSYALVALQTQN